jgi:CubicO group peptidase (beta-lactamase class C family)
MQIQRFIFTLLISSYLVSSQANTNDKEQVEDTLERYINVIKATQGFNGEILVARGDEIVFQKATGMASFEHQVALQKGAKYRIASITKSLTATLIMMAQQEGMLSIKDRVVDYIPQLATKFKDITIEHLLTHTSGLPHNEGIKDYWLIKSKLDMTTKQSLEEINQINQ